MVKNIFNPVISNQPKSEDTKDDKYHHCEICQEKFYYEGHLVRHMRAIHPPIRPKDPTIDPVAEAQKDCCDSWFCNCYLHCCCRDDIYNCSKWDVQYWFRTGKCDENWA